MQPKKLVQPQLEIIETIDPMLNRDVEIKIEKSMSKMLEQQVREIGNNLQVERGKRERLQMEVNFLKQVLYEKDKVCINVLPS